MRVRRKSKTYTALRWDGTVEGQAILEDTFGVTITPSEFYVTGHRVRRDDKFFGHIWPTWWLVKSESGDPMTVSPVNFKRYWEDADAGRVDSVVSPWESPHQPG